MSEQVRILSFYDNWVDIMEMCNPEEWYELSTIITNLRFKNIDTDPKTLANIKVKMAWTVIRPSILKSNRNTRYQENKAKKNTDITPNEEFDNTLTTGFPTKEEEQQRAKASLQDNDLQKNDFKASTSHVNDIDDTNYQNTIESASEAKEIGNTGIFQDDELIGTLKNEQFEVMKGKIAIEIEEQDLTNEEIVKRASNDFVNHYKIDAYNLWVEMNDRHRNGESYQTLWEKWVDMWRPFICTDRRIELQGDITNTVVNRYGKRYSKELKERQSDTTTVTKSNADPQNEVLNDNYGEDLNNFLDENEQRINGWVNAITNGIVYKTNITEFPKEMAIKNIEKIITDLGTDTKEALDFKEYMTEIIRDSIRRKRYEQAI